MQFEWDETKILENILKHEIDFANVLEVFADSMVVELDDQY
ncbi:hypothetical protein [Sphaerothrix gracilis]